MNGPDDPTHEQCSSHAEIVLPDGRTGWAAWYPQMGGYASHCVVVPGAGCFDIYVWHDGDFPFGDDATNGWGDPRGPAELHHCSAEQFVGFGEFLASLPDQPKPGHVA